MNSLQENKNSMYFTAIDYLTVNAAVVTPLPNYSALFTAFRNASTSIQTYGEQQAFGKKGYAENKTQLRNALVNLAVDVSRKITAYAKFVNNQVLLNEVKYSESDLKRKPDTMLRDCAQGLYDRAQANLPALSTYGITAATQTTFQGAINSFVASIPKPRMGITEKKQSTTQLANYFKAADAALSNIDALIEIIRVSQPNFYTGYKTARKIVDNGTGKLSVKGLVTDATTGEPIKGVSLTFILDGNSTKALNTKPVVKKTAAKGMFYIRSLPAGIYKVVITKNGYQKQETTLAVSDGEMSLLNIQLSKS
jgi:hypothetical protein